MQTASMNILERPAPAELAHFPREFGQRFIVTVDTEEEFDWEAPITRDRHGLVSVPALKTFQEFCEGFGVVPVYLLDYAVATSPVAAAILGAAVREGRAEIGVHLHPWVSPPFDDEVSPHNSYAGNLPFELEREKFTKLRDAIETNFGTLPVIYRAGRYGVGPDSARILREFGIAIDSSVRSRFDYSKDGGPDFHAHPLKPYWIDRGRSLLELPLTTVFRGPLRRLGGWLYPRLWRAPALRGVLAKLGMLERIPLTPEGVSIEEALRGVEIAIDDGLPVLVFSFHSPSLEPGHTPYVKSQEDLDRFYDWWRTIFSYLASRQVAPTCVMDILPALSLA